MSYQTPTSRYLENDVMSCSSEWLVPLLFEHLLISLRRADVLIETGDLEGKAVSLTRANSIVMELASTLNRDGGGELAQNLGSLYAFLSTELLTIGRTLDRELLGRLISIVADLHTAWVHAAEQVAPRGRQGAAAPLAARA